MFALPRFTARLAVVVSFAVLIASACKSDASAPLVPIQSTSPVSLPSGTITNPPSLQHGYLTVCKDTPAGTSGIFQIDAWIRFDDGTEHSVGTYIDSGECKPLFVSLPDPVIQVLENLGNGDPGWHLASVTRITDAGTDQLSGNDIGTVSNPVVCSIDFSHGCVLIFHNARD